MASWDVLCRCINFPQWMRPLRTAHVHRTNWKKEGVAASLWWEPNRPVTSLQGKKTYSVVWKTQQWKSFKTGNSNPTWIQVLKLLFAMGYLASNVGSTIRWLTLLHQILVNDVCKLNWKSIQCNVIINLNHINIIHYSIDILLYVTILFCVLICECKIATIEKIS